MLVLLPPPSSSPTPPVTPLCGYAKYSSGRGGLSAPVLAVLSPLPSVPVQGSSRPGPRGSAVIWPPLCCRAHRDTHKHGHLHRDTWMGYRDLLAFQHTYTHSHSHTHTDIRSQYVSLPHRSIAPCSFTGPPQSGASIASSGPVGSLPGPRALGRQPGEWVDQAGPEGHDVPLMLAFLDI